MFTNGSSDIFFALSDQTRLQIIEMLSAKGQLPANKIYAKFHVSHPAISQHLKVLRNANLVVVEKRAQQRIYQLNTQKIAELETYIHNLTHQWNKRLDRLEIVLRKEVKKYGREK